MKNVTPKGFSFSNAELKDLAKAWVALGIAFTVAFRMNVIISVLVVGAAFLMHELAHKYMAIKYRCSAEFKANDSMLIMMIFISLLGVILAAPGAVHIRGHMSRREYGLISLAGPATNLTLAAISIPIAIMASGTFLGALGGYSAFINAWIGMFNMIPFGMFDGRKILMWNREVYYATLVLAFIMVGVSQFV